MVYRTNQKAILAPFPSQNGQKDTVIGKTTLNTTSFSQYIQAKHHFRKSLTPKWSIKRSSHTCLLLRNVNLLPSY